jgi:hypothetical protein
MELMFEELKDEERIQEDVTMNEMELLRLKLKYKYKYKYKYEVKKRQDRSTPLLGDSWDLDPALKQSELGAYPQPIAGGASYQEAGPDGATENEEPDHEFDFNITSEQLTQDLVLDAIRGCKKSLDEVWTQMAVPPLQTSSNDKKELREKMRENRQNLLPQERALKALGKLLKDLVQVIKEAQKEHNCTADDGPTGLTTHQQNGTDTKAGEGKVQQALSDLAVRDVNTQSLTKKLIKDLRQQLELSEKPEEEEAGPTEEMDWNKSIFVEKRGRHVQATNTKKAGFREFKADPWYRKLSRYG